MTLALAGVSFACDREDADDAKRDSASSVTEPSVDGANTPSTKSLSKERIAPGSATGFSPYPDLSVVTDANADEKLLVELVNVERTARGLKPVAWDGMLSGLARMHSADMRAAGKASHHSSQDGATFGTRLARTPYRSRAAAENIAYNSSVVRAHRALMASPGHRHNILDPELTALGTAVLTDTKDEWLWVTEDFATPIAEISDAQAEQMMRDTLSRAHSRLFSLPEDKALSKQLDTLVEQMIESGSLRNAVGSGVGAGWTLAFTSLDPTEPPVSAIERAAKAESYALAVSFRKTRRYPFGAYWGILFLKGAY